MPLAVPSVPYPIPFDVHPLPGHKHLAPGSGPSFTGGWGGAPQAPAPHLLRGLTRWGCWRNSLSRDMHSTWLDHVLAGGSSSYKQSPGPEGHLPRICPGSGPCLSAGWPWGLTLPVCEMGRQDPERSLPLLASSPALEPGRQRGSQDLPLVLLPVMGPLPMLFLLLGGPLPSPTGLGHTSPSKEALSDPGAPGTTDCAHEASNIPLLTPITSMKTGLISL